MVKFIECSCTLQLIQKIYGDYLVAAESTYDVSIQFDLENLPANKGESDVLLLQVFYK